MRVNLKRFRVNKFLTQGQIAEMCGVSRGMYSFIELGQRAGSAEFWFNLQKEFNIPFDELCELRKIEGC